MTERKRVRNVRTEYEALESIFSKQKWITGKLSSVEVLKVSYCVICEVLGKKVSFVSQSLTVTFYLGVYGLVTVKLVNIYVLSH